MEKNDFYKVKSLIDQKDRTSNSISLFFAESKAERIPLSELYEKDNLNALFAGNLYYVGPKPDHGEQVQINYGSWQEDGVRYQIEGEKIIYKCVSCTYLDNSMNAEENRAYYEVKRLCAQNNDDMYTSEMYVPPENFTYRAIAGESLVFEYFTTKAYRIFYEFLFLLGLNGISDFFWSYKAKRHIFYSEKKVDFETNGYRTKYGEQDQVSAIKYQESAESQPENTNSYNNAMKMSLRNPYNTDS